MRISELFESANDTVAIMFGRFNPPHKGHVAAWKLAAAYPHWFVGTNKNTIGAKDPLPFDVKLAAMKTIWPEIEQHAVAETSWLTLASRVYSEYGDVNLVVLTDESWVVPTIEKYNGQENQHGFYNFKNIEHKATPRLSSASDVRDAVAKNDKEAFSKAAGIDADTKVLGKGYFDLVSEYLMPYLEKAKTSKKKLSKENLDIEVEESCKYGRYYCSTDKKWKCRTGPKQKRSS